jgi:lysophospholipase L1-like esterase
MSAGSRREPRPNRISVNWVLVSATLLICLAGAEAFVRTALHERFDTAPRLRRLPYRFDDQLGWFPQEGRETKTTGDYRTVRVRHNAMGFRDQEWGDKKRPRLAFVGDSFVWGFDAEQEERFTERIQQRLREWQVLNLGVSAYGTDQEYLVSQRVLPGLKPDIVLLVYALNYSRDNRTNFRYGAYKPFFVNEAGELRLRGVPVPKSLAYRYAQHPILFQSYLARGILGMAWGPAPPVVGVPEPTRELLLAERALVESWGVRFAVAFSETHKQLEAFCAESGVPFLDLAGAEQFPDGGHWTPAGHAQVASRVLQFLHERGWVPGSP